MGNCLALFSSPLWYVEFAELDILHLCCFVHIWKFCFDSRILSDSQCAHIKYLPPHSLSSTVCSLLRSSSSAGIPLLASASDPSRLHPRLRPGRGRHEFQTTVKLERPGQVSLVVLVDTFFMARTRGRWENFFSSPSFQNLSLSLCETGSSKSFPEQESREKLFLFCFRCFRRL